jgi:hypothetical protein
LTAANHNESKNKWLKLLLAHGANPEPPQHDLLPLHMACYYDCAAEVILALINGNSFASEKLFPQTSKQAQKSLTFCWLV